jgi:hypothetical protein
MARLKSKTVKSFGGVDSVGDVKAEAHFDNQVKDVNYNVQSLEVQSQTHLEDDVGHGSAAIIRAFEFAINPLAFQEAKPTKQELFNAHHKYIETALWKDGMKVMPEVNPRIQVDEKNMRYTIFVGAQPMKGHLLREQPKTLAQIAHGR